jgi:CRISPR-associated endonuclease/helicase Cas3
MPIFDYLFPLFGASIPVDHGYLLYSAVSCLLPGIHLTETAAADSSNPWTRVAIHPIGGSLIGNRSLRIDAASRLVVRAPHELTPQLLALAGKPLRLGAATLRLGTPSPRGLLPRTILKSRLVVIKGFQEPNSFLEAAKRQLDALGIGAKPAIPLRKSAKPVEDLSGAKGGSEIRRTLQIRDKIVVGFSLEVCDLLPQDSIKLQEIGLGGRRRFGCGIFTAAREKAE